MPEYTEFRINEKDATVTIFNGITYVETHSIEGMLLSLGYWKKEEAI